MARRAITSRSDTAETPIAIQVHAHLVVMPIPAWGHVRPLCAFLARVVHLQPAFVTFLIAGDNISRVQAELAQYFRETHNKELLPYIRVIGLGSLTPLSRAQNIFSMNSIQETYESMYRDMLQVLPVTCASTGIVHSSWISPTLVIADICSHFAIHSTRKISGPSVPVLAWVSTPASSLLRLFGEEMRGGIGDLERMIKDEMALGDGRRKEDIAAEVYRASRGSIVKVPGLPDHYDYEWHPQEPRAPSRIPWVIHKGYHSLHLASGALSLTCESYEPASTRAVHEWFAEDGRDFFCVGVGTVGIKSSEKANASCSIANERSKGMVSVSAAGSQMLRAAPGPGTKCSNPASSRQSMTASDNKVHDYLEMVFEKYGKHSLVYIAFGSVFWPKKSEHVWELISTLLDLEIPFILSHPQIFSHAPLDTAIPQDITERVKESGMGLMLEWAPQGAILAHPATGWFVSHCGANSVLESLYNGVPLICWPQEGDQPATAAYLTVSLNVSYEPIQVRTGLGRRKMYRHASPNSTPALEVSLFDSDSEIPLSSIRAEFRDILGKARGPDGERKREKAIEMSAKLLKAWGEGGISNETIRRFVRKFVLIE